jgi:hypothetical protein
MSYDLDPLFRGLFFAGCICLMFWATVLTVIVWSW